MLPVETLDKLLGLGATKANVQTVDVDDATPFVLVPEGMKVESLTGLIPPTRIKRNVNLTDADSFIAYVNRFKTENTLIFAATNEKAATFKALLDYHGPAPDLYPDYCDHVVSYTVVPTVEWQTWLAANKLEMSQGQFATWLEDNQKLFRDPAGASLLELVKTLEGKSDVRFMSAIRLDNGAMKLMYDEDVVIRGGPGAGQTSGTKDGAMEIPQVLTAGIEPFIGSEPYEVKARFKNRIEDRRLLLRYETIELHKIVPDAIKLISDKIKDETGIKPLLGTT